MHPRQPRKRIPNSTQPKSKSHVISDTKFVAEGASAIFMSQAVAVGIAAVP